MLPRCGRSQKVASSGAMRTTDELDRCAASHERGGGEYQRDREHHEQEVDPELGVAEKRLPAASDRPEVERAKLTPLSSMKSMAAHSMAGTGRRRSWRCGCWNPAVEIVVGDWHAASWTCRGARGRRRG